MRHLVKVSVAFALASIAIAAPSVALADPPPEYVTAVRTKLGQNVVYPRLAKLKGQEGTVGYLVKIDGSGGVTDASVETSSGKPALDQAVLDAAKGGAPYPAPPGGPAEIHGSVTFKAGD